MNSCRMAVVALAVAMIVGCKKAEETWNPSGGYRDYVELEQRLEQVSTGAVCKIAEMKPDDVIVAVNGYPYYRKAFDAELEIKAKQISSRKQMNDLLADELISQARRQAVPEFVRMRLLIDAAKRLKVMESNDVYRAVNDLVAKSAKARHRTPEKFLKSFPCDSKYVFYDLAQKTWVNALIAKEIPPDVKVTQELVKAIQDQVTADNAAANATNEFYRAQLAQWKADILSGKGSFAQLAKTHSQDYCEERDIPGFWGEWERGEIESKTVQAAVFSAKKGEITDPVEDDNGIRIVKILDIKPPQKNEKGRVVQDETRLTAHIYIEKEPLLIRQDDVAMMKDAKRQVQLQAVNKFVDIQMTNGLNRVVYPHGESLF